ncbi:MAG: hypothetical protein HY713_03010 [candidate division NC10 bacterium]|nr:hypothetical protein [candidate division NC10 bacterium]
MTYEDRMVTFREQLENLISVQVYGPDIITRSRPFLSVTPTEEIATPEIVLECLRQLRSVFRPDLL